MNTHDQGPMKQLLQQALPPVEEDAEPATDLWPAVLRKIDAGMAAPPWFDWALVAGLGVCAAAFPAWIPVLLYYL
jgi:hypothetical protein